MCLFTKSSGKSVFLLVVPNPIPLSMGFSKEEQLWAFDYSKVTETCWIQNKSSPFCPALILWQKANRRCRRGDDVQHTGCTKMANEVSLVSQQAAESLKALTGTPVLKLISVVWLFLMVSILGDIIRYSNPQKLYEHLPSSLSWHRPWFLCQAPSKFIQWTLNRPQCHFFSPLERLSMPYSCNTLICHTDQPLQRCSSNTKPGHPSWPSATVSH